MNRQYPKTKEEARELGISRYYNPDMKRCPRNHDAPRYARNSRCVECQKDSAKKYQKTSDKWKEYSRDYHKDYHHNPEKQEILVNARNNYQAKCLGETVEQMLERRAENKRLKKARNDARERGDKRYDGRECPNCASTERYVSSNGCILCHKHRYRECKKQ